MFHKTISFSKTAFSGWSLAGLLLSGVVGLTAQGQTQPPSPAAKPAATTEGVHYQPARFPKRAELRYGVVFGVDSLSVKYTESGEVIRFAYRVLDPAKAKSLNDKKAEPSLIDPQADVKLSVPALEKIGQLRQTGTQEAGTTYWMAFSNRGRLVKRGHRGV